MVLMPGLAFALPLSGTGTAAGAVNPVPINDSGSVVGNTAFDIALKAILTLNPESLAVCDTTLQGFEKTDTVTQVGFSFSAIIGGGNLLAAQYAKEITAYTAYLACLEGDPTLGFTPGVLPALQALTSPNIYTASVKEQYITKVNASIEAYTAKLNSAIAKYNVASQNIWKAFLITVLLQTTKVVADQLVNKLVNNFKIANIKAYTDSVATLMYDNQFIRDNFPDNQGQLMARAILTNPAFRFQVPPGIYVQADTALGYATLNPDDPYFYSDLAKAGFAATNPYYLHTTYVGGVDQSHGSALASAKTFISQGTGYKAPVNCAGSLAQQQQIDTATKAASDQLANRAALLQSLQNARSTMTNFTTAQIQQMDSDIAKAQADYNTALAAWNNLPFTVTGNNSVSNSAVGGGNNTEGTAAIVMCEAINSPAVLVNQGIDAMFKSLNLGQYTPNNLPGFLKAMAGIATQIGSSMVMGGITGHAVNINENMAAGAAVSVTQAATIQTLNNNTESNMAKGIDLEAYPNSGVTNGYTLTWTVMTTQIGTASYAAITGPGVVGTTTRLPLSGSMQVVSPTGGNYTLTVFDSSGKPLITAVATATPQQTAYNNNANSPTVAGAFTNQPVILPRGLVPVFAPRGE